MESNSEVFPCNRRALHRDRLRSARTILMIICLASCISPSQDVVRFLRMTWLEIACKPGLRGN